MKIYRDIKGNYWINDTIALAGNYKLKPNNSKTTVSIYSIDGDVINSIPAIYDILVTSILKEDDTSYTDFEEFYFEMAGLFKGVFDGTTGGFNTLATTDLDFNGRLSTNTVFGDKTVGIRRPSISAQFQYGLEEGAADAEVLNGGTVITADSLLVLSSGTNIAGRARVQSVETVRYIPGHESYCYFTSIFTTAVADSYQRVGLYDANNGFFVGYEGTTFTFTRRRAGVDYSQTIDVDAFSTFVNNKLPGYTLDPTKGNVYKISFGYLGFATVSLEIMLPNGSLITLAKIEYPNSNTVTHINQTFLPVRGEVGNIGNTTDIVIKSGSLSAGIVNGGTDAIEGRNFAWVNDATYIFSNNTTLVSFRNKTTFNSIDNKVSARLLFISGANSSNKTLRWRLLKNPTVTNIGAATWTDINTNNSILEHSEDLIVDFTADNELFIAWNTGKEADFIDSVSTYLLDLLPGGIASFTVESTATNAEVDLSIRWSELF